MHVYKVKFIITPHDTSIPEFIAEGFVTGKDIEDAKTRIIELIDTEKVVDSNRPTWRQFGILHSLQIEYSFTADSLARYLNIRIPWDDELIDGDGIEI